MAKVRGGRIMKRVKVVKREDRSRHTAEQAEAGGTAKGEPKDAERDTAAVISQWIGEFRHKRRAESRHAISNLFGVPATAGR